MEGRDNPQVSVERVEIWSYKLRRAKMRSYNLLLKSQSDINVDHMYPLPPAAKQERLLLNENLNIYIEHQAILNLNQVNLNEMF